MAEVRFVDVCKSFGHARAAVSHVDLQVADGEFLVLVGPSGCGKSTTLRLLAGLEDLDSGSIEIAGRDVSRVSPKDRDVAMVFQNYALYPHMSVYKNLAFGLELREGGSWVWWALLRLLAPDKARKLAERKQAIDLRVRTTAEMLGIAGLLERMPRQLSGGERQRVALGRAIVRQPKVFLFDEPLSNLDARLRVEMRRELKQLHQRLAATMIYVTHDQVEAMTLGQRVVVMHEGVVQQVGTPREIYDRPRNRFVAQFMGSPPMNLLEGMIEPGPSGQRFVLPGGGQAVDNLGVRELQLYVGRRVLLGLRAEDVHVDDSVAGPRVEARVSVVEPLGDATWVQCTLEGSTGAQATLVARAPARSDLKPGDQTRLTLDVRRAHWFDADSGCHVSLNPR